MRQLLSVEAWFVVSSLLAPAGYVVQDTVADAMSVEAVPRVRVDGKPLSEMETKMLHTTMQTFGRIAFIGGLVFVALLNIAMFAGVESLGQSQKADVYARIYVLALAIPLVSVSGVMLSQVMLAARARQLREQGVKANEADRLVYSPGQNVRATNASNSTSARASSGAAKGPLRGYAQPATMAARTNVWRKATSPAREPMLLTSNRQRDAISTGRLRVWQDPLAITADIEIPERKLAMTLKRVEPCMFNPLNPGNSSSLGTWSAECGTPLPIVVCVTCRSKNISSKKSLGRKSNAITFVCNDCGTALEQVGDQYKLTHVTDTGSSVWQKYAGKILFRREWSNIALGGYSDEELAIMWAPVASGLPVRVL